MAEKPVKASSEMEADHSPLESFRARDFYKQGFEGGLEVARQEVTIVVLDLFLTVTVKMSVPANQRKEALALYKEAYEVGQRVYCRKVINCKVGHATYWDS